MRHLSVTSAKVPAFREPRAKYVVEYIQFPLSTGWAGIDTVACVSSDSALIDFFEAELKYSIDDHLTEDIEKILEAATWPECTAFYRITRTTSRRARCFIDQ